MRCIRSKYFETNSSSTHSLVITKDLYGSNETYNDKWGLMLKKSDTPVYDFESIKSEIRNTQTRKDPHRVLELYGSEFGRENMRTIINSYNKANYLVTYIKQYIERYSERKYFEKLITNIIKQGIPEIDEVIFTNANEDNDKNPDYEDFYAYDDCNLDHEGVELARTILTSDGVKLKGFGVFTLYDFIFNTSYILLSGEYCGEYDEIGIPTTKIDDNTYFTNAFGLINDCTVKDDPTLKGEYKHTFPENIKLNLSYYNTQEEIDKLIED